MFRKKIRSVESMSLADRLTREVFSFCKENAAVFDNLTGAKIVELYRFSLCNALNLSTMGYITDCQDYVDNLTKRLVDILKSYGALNFPEDSRQGILEACVHCIEMSRERAGI